MPLWVLASIIITIFLMVLIMVFVKTVSSSEIFFKHRVARNLALDLDAVYSVPGNSYILEREIYNYSIRFNKEKVEVYKKADELDKVSYSYVKAGDQLIDYTFQKPGELVIAKINGKIIISDSVQEVTSILK